MKLVRNLAAALLLAISPLLVSAAIIEIKPLREDSVWTVGESAEFLVSAIGDDITTTGLNVEYDVRRDVGPVIKEGSLHLNADPQTVSVRLDEPASAQLRVTAGEVRAQCGAIFSPEKIAPGMAPPDDFSTFWQGKLAAQRELPMEAKFTPVENMEPGFEGYDLQLKALCDAPVSGYFVKPAGAAPKSLPAIVYYHGAGWDSANLKNAKRGAALGMLALDINALGLPNGMPADFYTDQKNNALRDYKYRGMEDRETYFFLGMFLRAVRAADFLCAQPEWDGKVLITFGSSQGGAQAIVVAGLDSRVTAIAANVPAMGDLEACKIGRRPGWPAQVDCTSDAILQTARYFDTANFARLTRASALFTVGLVDSTCPPASVFSTYNQLEGEKQILIRPAMVHELPWDLYLAMEAFAKNHAQEMP